MAKNCHVVQADVLHVDLAMLRELMNVHLGTTTPRVVLSDMAPSTTGHRSVDQARSFALFGQALDLAKQILPTGGNFVAKLFQGGDFSEAQQLLRAAFTKVDVVRPQATRTQSFECFLVGLKFRKP